MENLSNKQKEILEQFREAVRDELRADHDHIFLLRWLRARNFNLKNAEKMLRKSMEWRRQFGIDEIENWDVPEVLRRYMPGGVTGYDKEGSPVRIDLEPLTDWKGLVRSVKKRDILKMQAYEIEDIMRHCSAQSKKLGKPITQAVFIMDLEKLGTRHLNKDCIDTFNAMMEQLEANYPEITKYIFCIKAPKIFPIIYALARPFLSEETKKKVHVLGSNWKETLLKHIDADQLPVYWGGTKTGPDGDVYCSDKIKLGGEIPQSYYLKNMSLFGEAATRVTINHGATLQLEFNVSEAGCIIRWSFETKHYDIAYGIYLKTTDHPKKLSDMKQVVNSTRVNSHLVPEDGFYTCQTPGIYVFALDNTYSWTHKKEVAYIIEVKPPLGLESDPVGKQLENMSLEDNCEDNGNINKETSKRKSLVDVPF